MYYVDTQRTLTRRESSLITPERTPGNDQTDNSAYSPAPPQSATAPSESEASELRPKVSIQKELVTIMFDSMLNSIVASWEVIAPPESETATQNPFDIASNDLTIASKKRKSIAKPSKPTRRSSQMKKDSVDQGSDRMQQSWCRWTAPDERAIVRFRNGNVYEGSISMKVMHGRGRFQWADGTVYLGEFDDNKITGKGMIQWKDDSWYEGDFVGNLRHGRGLYVDSRKQRSYAGGWHCGTKHGQGVIYYSESFKNSYDGEWEYNVRHGYGSREYSQESGYKGEWDQYVREGNGSMIWPNHDFYSGQWKNGVMSGYGIYIWDTYSNNSLSLPSIAAYRGNWLRGERHGYGVLNLGSGMGSYYKGEFKNNKKHGVGRFVTNNGLILENRKLFVDDNFGTLTTEEQDLCCTQENKQTVAEPYMFDICDNTIGFIYHVQEAIKNIDKQEEVRANIISDYIENNKSIDADLILAVRNENQNAVSADIDFDDLIEFEECLLRKALRCYETDLKNIYYKYATICNTDEIQFTPILIRLFLWQFYYDCNMHEKGLTLVDIDKMFDRNPEWLSKSAHDPFEKIYFWQFLNSLISVASKLYAKRELPGPKPDTILASGFRTFMEIDVLPNVGQRKGRLVNGYGQYIPLKGLYALYCSIGEPHTVRDFLCAVRRPPHDTDKPQPPLIDAPDECLPLGRNAYVIGDNMIFVADEDGRCAEIADYEENDLESPPEDLRLFNFGNLSSQAIIKIFANIFPQLCHSKKIMSLDIQITFFEFFEAFIACAEESIKVKDEEMRWREKFSTMSCVSRHQPKSK